MRKTMLLSCVLLAGCAAVAEQQCRTTDWYEQGHQEAMLGNQPRAEQYAQCSGFRESDYMNGWSVGYSEWNSRISGGMM